MQKRTSYGEIGCSTHAIRRFRERSGNRKIERLPRTAVARLLRRLIREGRERVAMRKFHVSGQTFHVVELRCPQDHTPTPQILYAFLNRTEDAAVVRTVYTKEQFERWQIRRNLVMP